jgi:glycosyltransferase involved in cell wall biosynthesis
MRGYWIDELADGGRWFKSRTVYKIGKRIELSLLKDSAAIVTLTELQARDLRFGELKYQPDKPIITITTCADYDEFAPQGPSRGVVPEEVRERLQGKLVVGLVGSINASYSTAASLSLFDFLLTLRPDAHLLCLTRQLSVMEKLLRERGIPESAYTLATVGHQDMSEWLRQMDWALLLLNTGFSKRGSMPTKLAEFFSAGVRPIQYGCNDEVSERVRAAGSGIVLESLSAEDLHKTALTVASATLNQETIMKARETTRPHFSLEAGVNKYAELFNKLLWEDEK